MNTIGDMQNEKDYLYHIIEFENNHDLVVIIIIIIRMNFEQFNFFKR